MFQTKPSSSCAGTKNISDRAFVHTQKAASTDRFCAEAMLRYFGLKVNRHISDRFSLHFLEWCEQRIEPKRSCNEERGLDSSGKMSAVLGHFCPLSCQAGEFFTTA